MAKGHWDPDACGVRHSEQEPSEGEDVGEYKLRRLGRNPPAVCSSPLPPPPWLVPLRSPGLNFLLGWFPLFAMFPLYHRLCFLLEIDPESGMDYINTDHILLEEKPYHLMVLIPSLIFNEKLMIGHRDACRGG